MAAKIETIRPGVIRYKNIYGEYIFWIHANTVIPFIERFLKQKFPNSLVFSEFNDIDLVVVKENLPVEIQSSIVSRSGVKFSDFEERTYKQIRENIESHKVCWFFFDSELLRYIQNPAIHRRISIGMDWLRIYMKENQLKVFVVNHDGKIVETNYKDFDFLSDVSMTCKIGYESDIRVLNRNKINIFGRIIEGSGYTQEEIDKIMADWPNPKFKDTKSFLYKHENKRARLLARILHGINGYLEPVNDILDLNIENVDMQHEKYYLSVFGLFEFIDKDAAFIDKFHVREYFPGYLRNKDTWDHLLGRRIQGRKLDYIIKKEYTITKGVDYFWNKAANIQ